MIGSRRTRLATWVALSGLVGACSCGEDAPRLVLEIVSPPDGSTFNVAHDLDPETPGVQVEARIVAQNLDGAEVRLVATDGEPAEVVPVTIEAGEARVVFTIAGDLTLVARARTAEDRIAESPSVSYTFDPSPRACRFLHPEDGSVLGPDDDESALEGFQVTARVRCVGVEFGNPVTLRVGGSPVGQAPLAAEGVATFERLELAEGANVLEASVEANGGESLQARATVTVDTGSCRVVLRPPTGTVFNAFGEGDHASVVADLEPGPPMQARLRVEADCPGATILLRRGTSVIADGVAGDQPIELPVTLEDGEVQLRAVATGSAQGVSPPVVYLVDAVVPTAKLDFPLGGETFGDRDDRSEAPGLQIAVRGGFEGIGAGAPFEVVLRTGEANEVVVPGELDGSERFDVLVTLPDGAHSLFVRAARPSGTTASTTPITFSSAYLAASVAIQSPLDGETFPLGRDANPSASGYQVRFQIAATQLDGASGVVTCGGAVAPFVVESGAAAATVTLNPQGCAGAWYTCRARVQTADGGLFESATARILVDQVPPQPTLISPENGAILSSNMVTVSATTVCAGEEQWATLLHGFELIAGPVPVAGNGVLFDELLLPSGESTLGLVVTDAAGNSTEVPFTVFVDADAPEVVFVEPPAGEEVVFGAADDEQGTLDDGLQRTVVLSVDNESAGTLVELRVGDRRATTERTALEDGQRLARFSGVSLPEGPSVLRACAVDDAGNVGCAEQPVRVSTGRPICNVTWPRDGSALGRRDDQEPGEEGVTTDLVVGTDLPVGSVVAIGVDGPEGFFGFTVGVAAGETLNEARVSGYVFPVEGKYMLHATCGSDPVGHSLDNEVVVDFTPPVAEVLRPEEGQVFNLASPDRSAAPGFHIDVKVRSDKPALGGLAFLTVSCGEGPQELTPLQLNSLGEATFRAVRVPDQASCTLDAWVEDAAGNESEVVIRRFVVDRIAPSISITAPQDGALFGAAHDADPNAPGFQLGQVVAQVSDAGRPAATRLFVADVEVAGGSTTILNPPANTNVRSTWLQVLLEEGHNDLLVVAEDEAGNTASRTHSVTVDTRAPVVQITSHINGQVLNGQADISPSTPGLQQNVRLTGEKLSNGTRVQICSPQGASEVVCSGGGFELAAATLTSGEAMVPGVTFPEGNIVIYAVATDVAGNSARSANVSLKVDSVPPVVDSLQILQVTEGGEVALDTQNGSAVFGAGADSSSAPGFQSRLRAQISGVESGFNLQAAFVTTNPVPGTILGFAPIDASGSATLDVTLAEGGHRIHVRATDAAGNANSTPEKPISGQPPRVLNFAVDTTPPSLAIVRPQPGSLLVRDDLDPGSAGVQADIEVDSDAGAGRIVSLYLDGEPLTTATLPLTGRRAIVRATFPDGEHVLSARVTDPAGNEAITPGVALLVDSIAPTVAIETPPDGANLGGPGGTPDTDPGLEGFQVDVRIAYGQIESGRPIVLLSSTGGVLATSTSQGESGSRLLRVTLSAGEQQLRARATDASGNVSESIPVTVTVDVDGPAVNFVRTDNPLLFGTADSQGGNGDCLVTVATSTSASSGTVEVLVDGIPGGSASIAGGRADISDVSLPPNVAVQLQLRATDGEGRVGYSPSRQAMCDLSEPNVVFSDPSSGAVVKYVAFGNPGNVAGARADKLPTPQLEADFTLTVSDAAGGSLSISSDLDGELAVREIDVDGAVSFTNLVVPSKGRHVLTATVRNAAGNERTATLEIDSDVVAPAAVTPGATVLDGRRSLVNLMFAAPGDDGAGGGPVAGYAVRRSSTPITSAAAWASAEVQEVGVSDFAAPGTTQALLVDGLAFEREYHFAVRAVDSIGNLGPLGGNTSVDLRLGRQHVSIPQAGNALQMKVLVADLDGDGHGDIISSSATAESGRGEVAIFYGGSRTVGTPVRITGAVGTNLGWSVAVGDVNGDGLPDLLVGAPRQTAPGSASGARDGAVHVFLGAANTRLANCTFGAEVGECRPAGTLFGRISASDGPTTITAGFGVSLAVVDDLDGDGIRDVVVGSPYENGRIGRAYVFSGREDWEGLTVADALSTITAEFQNNLGPLFGLRLQSLGDLDGDGHGDFASTAAFGTFAAGDRRHRPAYVISGRLARGEVLAERISATLQRNDLGEESLTASQFGYELAVGDYNGDGVRDLALTDPTDGRTTLYSGAAIGPHVPQQPLETGSALAPVGSFGRPRIPVTNGAMVIYDLGDVNGDGIDDFAATKASAPNLNEVHIWFGRASGTWPSEASVIIERRDVSKEAGGFGGWVGAGFVTAREHRDIVVGDFNGGATVLSDR